MKNGQKENGQQNFLHVADCIYPTFHVLVCVDSRPLHVLVERRIVIIVQLDTCRLFRKLVNFFLSGSLLGTEFGLFGDSWSLLFRTLRVRLQSRLEDGLTTLFLRNLVSRHDPEFPPRIRGKITSIHPLDVQCFGQLRLDSGGLRRRPLGCVFFVLTLEQCSACVPRRGSDEFGKFGGF